MVRTPPRRPQQAGTQQQQQFIGLTCGNREKGESAQHFNQAAPVSLARSSDGLMESTFCTSMSLIRHQQAVERPAVDRTAGPGSQSRGNTPLLRIEAICSAD